MKRDDLYYGEAIRQTNEQCESRRHFDSIAAQTLGFSAVSFTFLLAKWHFTTFHLCFVVLSLFFFSLVAISTILALWLRKWELTPPLSDLYKHMESREYEDEALALWAGQALSDSIDNNDKVLYLKAGYLKYAYIFLGLEVVSIGIVILSSFFITFKTSTISKFCFRNRLWR